MRSLTMGQISRRILIPVQSVKNLPDSAAASFHNPELSILQGNGEWKKMKWADDLS